jgi:hypothetical protein
MAARWELPAEPGPEVTAVRTDLGTTFVRGGADWISIPGDGAEGGWRVNWREIVVFGLTDVTNEFEECA